MAVRKASKGTEIFSPRLTRIIAIANNKGGGRQDNYDHESCRCFRPQRAQGARYRP